MIRQVTTEQERSGDWSWFCAFEDCRWSGMGCPSEDFARREGERHVASDHGSRHAPTPAARGDSVAPGGTA